MKTTKFKNEAVFGNPVGTIELNAEFRCERELTDSEKNEFNTALNSFIDKVAKNTYRNSDKYKKRREEEKRELLNCFDTAIYVEETINQYDKDSSFPWYQVTTKRGRFIIGWRKTVIHISWDETNIDKSGLEIETDNTKGYRLLHAKNYEEAASFIKQLLES